MQSDAPPEQRVPLLQRELEVGHSDSIRKLDEAGLRRPGPQG